MIVFDTVVTMVFGLVTALVTGKNVNDIMLVSWSLRSLCIFIMKTKRLICVQT